MLSTNVKKKRYKLLLKASSSLLRKQFTYRLSLPRSERNIYHQKQRVDLYAMAFTDAGCRLEALHPQEISLVDDLSTRAYIFCWFLLAKLEPRFGPQESWALGGRFINLSPFAMLLHSGSKFIYFEDWNLIARQNTARHHTCAYPGCHRLAFSIRTRAKPLVAPAFGRMSDVGLFAWSPVEFTKR